MLQLTIVMPCYNEGTRIYRNLIETITQVEKFCDSFRILVVNDGSTDETENEVKRAMSQDNRIGLITYSKNRGKGYAVRRGIMNSQSEYVAFLDSDLELPPYLLENFLKRMKSEPKVGIVIGSKGTMLKEIGGLARKDIETLLGSQVFLDLWVKVKKDWRNRTGVLHNFGFGGKDNA